MRHPWSLATGLSNLSPAGLGLVIMMLVMMMMMIITMMTTGATQEKRCLALQPIRRAATRPALSLMLHVGSSFSSFSSFSSSWWSLSSQMHQRLSKNQRQWGRGRERRCPSDVRYVWQWCLLLQLEGRDQRVHIIRMASFSFLVPFAFHNSRPVCLPCSVWLPYPICPPWPVLPSCFLFALLVSFAFIVMFALLNPCTVSLH